MYFYLIKFQTVHLYLYWITVFGKYVFEYTFSKHKLNRFTLTWISPVNRSLHWDKMAAIFHTDNLKRIFLNENVWISISISLQFVPRGPINNIPALVQIMAWRRPGDKHYLDQWWLVYRRIYASLGLNVLISANQIVGLTILTWTTCHH